MEITPTGSTLLITKGNKTVAYQKKSVSFQLANGTIIIRFRGKDSFYITDFDEVTNLPATSMMDLYEQLQQLKTF